MKKLLLFITGLMFVQVAFCQVDRFRGDVIIDGELKVANSIIPVEVASIITSSQLLSGDSIVIINDSITEVISVSAELVFGTTPYSVISTDTIFIKTLSGVGVIKVAGIEPTFMELTENKISGGPVSTQQSDGKIYWIDIPSGLLSGGDSGLIVYTRIQKRD